VLSGSGKLNPKILIPKELSLRKAKFTKKADVFAAGIIFLELMTLCSPEILYKVLWPGVLQVNIPPALKVILKMSLESAPEMRTGSFKELLLTLESDEGKAIGELSKNEELSYDISSGLSAILPSRLATDMSTYSRNI
jgi:hypothetical protein